MCYAFGRNLIHFWVSFAVCQKVGSYKDPKQSSFGSAQFCLGDVLGMFFRAFFFFSITFFLLSFSLSLLLSLRVSVFCFSFLKPHRNNTVLSPFRNKYALAGGILVELNDYDMILRGDVAATINGIRFPHSLVHSFARYISPISFSRCVLKRATHYFPVDSVGVLVAVCARV